MGRAHMTHERDGEQMRGSGETCSPLRADLPPLLCMTNIIHHSVVSLASRVRYKEDRPEEAKQDYGSLIKPPKYGSFNLLYPVEFADGVKWLLRIPSTSENGRFTTNSSRSLR